MSDTNYHHGNLKEALLHAGLAILEEDGLLKISLRKCAERVGVSHTAPKNHFGNMTGLLTAIAATGYTLLADKMRTEADDQTDRRNAALTGYVAFASENPALYELMFARERITFDDPEFTQSVGACSAILAQASKDLNWDRAAEKHADTRAQMLLWSTVHGYAQLHISGRFKKPEMKALDITDILPKF